MVGDEHHRTLRRPVAGLCDHVPGPAPGQQRAPKPQAPTADVVPDGRGADQSRRARDRAPEAAAAPQREHGAGGREQVCQAERPPVGAVRPLLLHDRPAAELAQPSGDRLRRPPLPVRGRWALEAGQLVDRGAPVARLAARAVLAWGPRAGGCG